MSREPQVGYNHNVRYHARVYHVQTEDAGVRAARIDTHLFYRGTIVCSARETYERDDSGDAVTLRMRGQHKTMMKALLRGELDTRIVALLGALEGTDRQRDGEDPTLAKVRSYRHRVEHAGRFYSIQTDFYATVVTDLFHETVYIGGERQDCRGSAAPGSDGVRIIAQEQHKRVIRTLRAGQLDERIIELFGSLSPRKRFRPSTAQVAALLGVVTSETAIGDLDGDAPADSSDDASASGVDSATHDEERSSSATHILRHRLRRGELVFDVTTELHGPDMPKIVTAVMMRDTLLTSQTTDYGDLVGADDTAERANALATQQHKRMLEDLRRGALDETVALLEEMLD